MPVVPVASAVCAVSDAADGASDEPASKRSAREPAAAIEARPQCTKLALLNAHPRDSRVSFQEEGHRYAIDGDEEDIISVTTLIHQYCQPFDADAIIAKMRRGPGTKYRLDETPDEIKAKWKAKGEQAAQDGTRAHASFEMYWNDVPVPVQMQDTVEYQQFLQFVADHPHLKPFRTEWVVFDEDLRLCGSIDMVFSNAENPNELYIYDWKRIQGLKETNRWTSKMKPPLEDLDDLNGVHYELQLSTYASMLFNKYYPDRNKTIEDLVLIIVHPDAPSGTYDLVRLAPLYAHVDKMFEARRSQLAQIREARRQFQDGLAKATVESLVKITDRFIEQERGLRWMMAATFRETCRQILQQKELAPLHKHQHPLLVQLRDMVAHLGLDENWKQVQDAVKKSVEEDVNNPTG